MLPEHHFSSSPESPGSPCSSESSVQNFIPKLPPSPGDYFVQVQKDRIFRVPPPQNSRRMAVYTRRASSRRRRTCLRCLAWAASPILLLAAALAVLCLVFRPQKPVYSITALSIAGFNVSSSSYLSPTFLATVRAENPNQKIGLSYLNGGDVTVSFAGVSLCRGDWPAFFQGRRNLTSFQVPMTGAGIRLSSAMRQQLEAAQRRREVALLIGIKVPVRLKVGAVTSWTTTVNARCDVTVDTLTAESNILTESCQVKNVI
ncbi:NDR1/HIN1-like protein 13 [Curcuma longa]|uniref:NDR1/HIN1-like protein 13 n=1 Tax=Curcuma longa TaxID=136217 RepID=UPI003D9E2E4B